MIAAVIGSFPLVVLAEAPKVEAVTAWEIRGTDRTPAGVASNPPSPGLTVLLRVDGLDNPTGTEL